MHARKMMVTTALSMVISAGAFAQSAKTPSTEGQKSNQTMSMADMTKECRDHCTKASKSMDETMTMLKDAQQSNDVKKMRTALDETEKQMTGMKGHMDMCMNMMDMMQKMGGMMKK